VSDKEDLTDKLSWIKFSSIAWTHDEKGFFYARYPQPSNAGSDLGEPFVCDGSVINPVPELRNCRRSQSRCRGGYQRRPAGGILLSGLPPHP